MAVQTRCPQCNKRYVAPDHMAGRRVRCRDCGSVFALPAEPDPHYRNEGAAGSGGSSVAADALSASSSGTHVAPGASKAGVAVAQRAQLADEAQLGVAAVGSDLQALEAAKDEAGTPGWTPPPRVNVGFDFPLSRYVDRWLPLVLLLIAASWLLSRTVASNPAGPGWVTVVRVLVFLAAFAAIVFPAGRYALRRAAPKLHFALPPQSSWRLFAALSVPFAAAVAMWLVTDGALSGLVLGCVAGSIVLAGGLWLLFRLRPEELPITLGAGVGAYVASVALSAGLLVVTNQIMAAASAGGDSPTQLAMSPLGPGLPWPPPAAPRRRLEGGPSKMTQLPTVASMNVPTIPPVDLDPPERRPSDLPPGTDTSPGSETARASSGTERPGAPTDAEPSVPTQPQQQPAPPPTLVAVTPQAAGANGRLVESVEHPIAKPIREVLYAPGNPDLLAVVRSLGPAAPSDTGGAGGVRDEIQVWNAKTWKQMAASLPVGRPAGPAPTYHLSPDGKRVAYLSEFPGLSIRVVSFETGGASDLLLNRTPKAPGGRGTLNLGQPDLLGFSSPTELVVHWKNGAQSGIEIRSLTGGSTQRPLRTFDTRDFQTETGHAALSPRDRRLAVLTHNGPTAELYLYDLGARGDPGRDAVHAVVPGLDWNIGVTPTALQFSPDGSRLAALFILPGDDKAYFVYWHVRPGGGGGLVELGRAFNYFSTLRAPGSRGIFYGPSLRWLAGGDAWLVYGSAVFDVRSGKHLGDLGLPNVVAHGTDGEEGCHVLQMGENPGASPADAGLTLAAVKLRHDVMTGDAPPPPPEGGNGANPPTPNNRLFDVPASR